MDGITDLEKLNEIAERLPEAAPFTHFPRLYAAPYGWRGHPCLTRYGYRDALLGADSMDLGTLELGWY